MEIGIRRSPGGQNENQQPKYNPRRHCPLSRRRQIKNEKTPFILSDLLPSEIYPLCSGAQRAPHAQPKKENDHDKTRLRKALPPLPGCGNHRRILRHAPHRRYLRPEAPAQKPVEHYVIRHTYYIPKAKIIDFMLSPSYLQVLNRFRRDTK